MSRSRRKLVRRVRRRCVWGGRYDLRVYDDGTARIRVDHPSNDPEVELAIAGATMKVARQVFADAGMRVDFGPITWRDDP